jgi:hypothetical protein
VASKQADLLAVADGPDADALVARPRHHELLVAVHAVDETLVTPDKTDSKHERTHISWGVQGGSCGLAAYKA